MTKNRKLKKLLASAQKSNKTPPIWVLQRTEDMEWLPIRNRTRDWRSGNLANKKRKKIKES